jgi:hypothetical protein
LVPLSPSAVIVVAVTGLPCLVLFGLFLHAELAAGRPTGSRNDPQPY